MIYSLDCILFLLQNQIDRSWHLPSNLSVGLDCFSPRSKLLLFLYVYTCVHFSFPSPIQKEKLWTFLVSFAWQMFNSIKSIKVGKWLNTYILRMGDHQKIQVEIWTNCLLARIDFGRYNIVYNLHHLLYLELPIFFQL